MEFNQCDRSSESMAQAGESLLGLTVVHADGQRLGASHHNHQFSAAGYRRVNQVALKQDIMLGEDR
jgi:hypothetical protein